MDRYVDAVEAINKMASLKMVMNRHKGNIEDLNVDAILALMKGEIGEIEEALEEDNLMHIIEEAADVQNFLVALVQQQINRYRARK